jgi:transitional endoplasmic reticulum ATPase
MAQQRQQPRKEYKMGKSLSEAVKVTDVAEVVHHGEQLIIPENMDIPAAIKLLRRRSEYLEQAVVIQEKFDVFPFDGAYALSQVIIARYGWAEGKPIQSMFGEQKPQVFKISISPTEKVDVPWGQFQLPNIDGTLMTGVNNNADGRMCFELSCTVKRKHEVIIRNLFDDLREYLRENSIYRGKAIKLRFRDDDGNTIGMPEPEFMNLTEVHEDCLLLNDDLMASVNANLFTPITRVDDCIANGIKVKRGILLGGKFGTGKTLAAMVAAKLAQDNNITYVYTPRANELGDAIAFAKQYQSPACVVFCEDIDRQVSGKRTVEMDDILNILDGIDTKSENIITVLTTNYLDNVNQAMLRPGRLDAIINIETPDASTAERLVRFYGAEAINEEEDLTEVGLSLENQIPAVIEEAVKRAKLFQLALIDKGAAVSNIGATALRQAAVTMTTQIDLLADPVVEEEPTLDKAMKTVVKLAVEEEAA